jgi:nanoRNase/pAp phosphatase (c-di-AMP/oligoRNAs hydrolase)
VVSGSLTKEEIMNPQSWILLGFIMDPRTGLGRFRNFTISNYDLMKKLAKDCVEKTIDQILAMPDVKERIDLYFEQNELFKAMIQREARVDGSAVLVDLRKVDPIYVGNRFLLYTLFPEQNISIWIINGKGGEKCVITVGYSIINKTAVVDVGSMLLAYGGGGHRKVGTCQVPFADADRIIAEIRSRCNQ